MAKFTKKKISFSSVILTIIFLVSISSAYSQNSNKTSDKKYVRMDIGHEALHCPFLSPKLEARLKEINNIENFFIDKRNSYATFNLPSDTEMTVELLKKIGTDVGYPADDVIIAMDNKPIKPAAKH
ncbi:MAG: hypothetical protein V4608_14475 [Bacteroidota bacterium]